MKITLLCVGKTDDKYLETGIQEFQKRLGRYISFQMFCLPDVKNSSKLTQAELKIREGKLILSKIKSNDFLVLLDEKGKEFRSVDFANYLEKQMIGSISSMVFVIGGPYGFDKQVYDRAQGLISLSKMTFSHQMIRLFFVEQLYRGMSILKGLPYHHE
ncbi:MAG TPA: 23S rRNA (pseudouridine(1915)-N(3))-methyltransferase RlmH [Candidatus Sphingobacterium stercoripullorum]|uniref:Ribosomal RNA large subunit methyltransferase H n=1 Tax=Candidatus Sphingobacterium stercoripullorum TaxID=2838759 RepID=A0A9D1W884_9SPHI|nr:23S rRNA (pseudouridine(1915)-N(3))-methyltransferase RlmH [Candidatus Sphingobacterium stercoripullorum]